MNFWPSFTSWPLAVAGLVCAAGPLVIHLLNRRRYRVVRWGATQFLREVMQRNRRILRLRDLLLLALRTLVVLLIGLGLAGPYFARTGADEEFDGRQPLHAVLLVDNSLSMGLRSLEGTVLDEARRRAAEFIERLPPGSRVSVIPLCGSAAGVTTAPFASLDHALEALERTEVVGRSASIPGALSLAREACNHHPELAKRVVLLTDGQRQNWRNLSRDAWDPEIPVQVVEVGERSADSGVTGDGGVRGENTWVGDIRLQDGLADTETPATIIVELRHVGSRPREDVQVTLEADGTPIGTQTITLSPAEGSREVLFDHVFDDARPAPGETREVVLKASLPPDRLPLDDVRERVVQTVAALPVVFVDELGADGEDIVRGRVGETRHLRRLLAPRSRGDDRAALVQVRHLSWDQLDRDQLADAPLCVVAGVESPTADGIDLLREYVAQGGQLVLAAGGRFDPVRWDQLAGASGAGWLPAHLAGLVGATPAESAGTLSPFFLDYDSLVTHSFFQLAGVPQSDLQDLYAEPLFFKAVRVDVTGGAPPAAAADLLVADRWVTWASRLADSGDISEEDSASRNADRVSTTNSDGTGPSDPSNGTDDADLTAPGDASVRVLGRFDRDRLPFLVERSYGEGRVLFVSTGLLTEWNTLAKTNAVLVLDRVLRGMLQATLAERNLSCRERLSLPLPQDLRRSTIALIRPDGQRELLSSGFIGAHQWGVTMDRVFTPGLYRLETEQVAPLDAAEPSAGASDDAPSWSAAIALSAPADESDLSLAPPATWSDAEELGLVRIGPNEPIRLAGAQIRGHDLWWYLLLTGVVLLLAEMVILATTGRVRVPLAAGGASRAPAAAPSAGEAA